MAWMFLVYSNSVNFRMKRHTMRKNYTFDSLSLLKWSQYESFWSRWWWWFPTSITIPYRTRTHRPTDTFWFNQTFCFLYYPTIQPFLLYFFLVRASCNKVKMAYWQFSSLFCAALLHPNTKTWYTTTQAQERLGKRQENKKRKCKKHIASHHE